MIILGDSVSDQGRLANFTDGKSEEYQKYPIQVRRLIDLQVHQVPPKDIQCNNRFSDGQNWVDYFQNTYDIQVHSQAVGGASIHDQKIPFKADMNLWGQQEVTKSLHEQQHQLKTDIMDKKLDVDTDDIVFIMAGGNDLLIQPNNSNVEQMAADMVSLIKDVKTMGYTKVLAGNLPQLPYLPYLHISGVKYPDLGKKIKQQNELLITKVNELNIYFKDNQSPSDSKNQFETSIFDLTSLVKNFDKQWTDVNTMSIPCQFGACTSHTAQQFNFLFSNKFRVRTESEEQEYQSQFTEFYTKANLIESDQTLNPIDKEIKKKYLNTRCDPSAAYKQIFQDDLHPMSHGFRKIAEGFDDFIRATAIGGTLPPKRDIVAVQECQVKGEQFHKQYISDIDKTNEEDRQTRQNKIKYLIKLMSDHGDIAYVE